MKAYYDELAGIYKNAVSGTFEKINEAANSTGDAAENEKAPAGERVQYSKKVKQGTEGTSIKEQIRNNLIDLNNMDVAKTVEYQESTRGTARRKATEVFRNIGYKVDRKGFGIILLGENEIDTAFNYLYTQGEFAAVSAVPAVLKRGIQLPEGHTNHKGRNVTTVTFAAPVEINGTRGILAVAVKQTGKNRYKTHRILMPDGSMFTFDTKEAESTGSGVVTENSAQWSDIDSASKQSISQTATESQEKNQYSRKTGRSAVYYAYEIMDMFGIKKDAKNRDSIANTLEQMLNSVRADGEYMNDDFMRLMAEKAADLILPDVKRRRSDRANEILREIRGEHLFLSVGKNAGELEYNSLGRQ